ncbi:polyadenylate-binding protein 2 isoform X2 [Daucus carota subsp. sativus]
MFSNRDSSTRISSGNIFIKNLDKSVDHKGLHDTFSPYGNILSCKIATDFSGQSKGYGFVQYDSEESAQKAIEQLNGMLINDKPLFVGPFLSKQERELAADGSKFTNVYVKNLSAAMTEEDLYNIFGEFGKITSSVVMKDTDGKSKCFGFVNFENADDASRSVQALNGKIIDQKEWYVGKAQRKSEREQELKLRYEQSVNASTDNAYGLNLYVQNLDDSFDDTKLKEVFAPFGTVTSSKVIHDAIGLSKGLGFVSFSAAEEALRAISEMNGKIVGSKPLYVALAQSKEDRRARLQEQHSNMHPVAVTSLGPRMPMYPPGGPGLPQRFYGQGRPAFIPPQPGFGYQPQLIPGMRPGGRPMPNFLVPMPQQGQQGLSPGVSRHAGMHALQAGLPMQPQTFPRGAYHPPHGRGMPVPMRGMVPPPFNVGGMQDDDEDDYPKGCLPISFEAFAYLLEKSTPEDQKLMLGENLYPMVEKLEPNLAAKVTGMLLEMPRSEILPFFKSKKALKAKVAEALQVLKIAKQKAGTPVGQPAASSPKDGVVS